MYQRALYHIDFLSPKSGYVKSSILYSSLKTYGVASTPHRNGRVQNPGPQTAITLQSREMYTYSRCFDDSMTSALRLLL